VLCALILSAGKQQPQQQQLSDHDSDADLGIGSAQLWRQQQLLPYRCHFICPPITQCVLCAPFIFAGKQQPQLFGDSDSDADLGIGSDDDFGAGSGSGEGEEGSEDDSDGMSDDDEQLAIERHNKLLEKAR
jgi:hypothetical protein